MAQAVRQITVRVVPRASRNLVKEEDGCLKVYLTAPAMEGRANKALIELLAEHYTVKRKRIAIVRGLKSRDKVVRIENERE